jgi:secondary thiamine-phosphate synthase enzyme
LVEFVLVSTDGQGLYDIGAKVADLVAESGFEQGLCSLFVQHTSASLLVQENYDPSAKYDLEQWLNRLVPEGDPLFTHTLEGADDMPAHIKSALTPVNLNIPIFAGKLALGTGQGLFLWEHRHDPQTRKVAVHIG